MAINTNTIKFTKKFVSGVLEGLEIDEKISYPQRDVEKEFAFLKNKMEEGFVFEPYCSTSNYIIVGVELDEIVE